MAETTKCFRCSADIVVLSMYNGIERAFEVLDETDFKVPDTMRWHVRRDSNVAVPASMIPSAACPSDGYLVRHRCAQSRRGTGEPELERFAVTSATGPRVHETQLEPPYEYAYRWPTSWAHITVHGGTLCGARQMIRDMSVAEMRRMMPMPVCAKCLDRYRLNRSTPPQAHGPASQAARRRRQTA